MKKLMQYAVMVGMALGAVVSVAQTSAPVKDDLFAGTEIFAKGASDVTEVTMDPDTLDMVTGRDGKRAHSMVLNVVRTYSYDKPGMYRIEDVDAFRNKLNTGDWHCSVHTRSLKTGDSTDVCSKRRTDDMVESAIITVTPKSLTFIHSIRKKGEGEHSEWGTSMLSIGGLPALAMLDADAIPNIDVNVDLAVSQAMHQLNTIDFDAMQVKIKDQMKDFDKVNSEEMKKRMAKEMEKFKIDQKKMQEQMHSLPNGDLEPPPEPKQPE